jgi:hypothetical protein
MFDKIRKMNDEEYKKFCMATHMELSAVAVEGEDPVYFLSPNDMTSFAVLEYMRGPASWDGKSGAVETRGSGIFPREEPNKPDENGYYFTTKPYKKEVKENG